MWLNVHTCVHFSPDICAKPAPLFFKDNILEIILMQNIFSILNRLGCFLRFTSDTREKEILLFLSIFCFKSAFIQAYRACSGIGRKTRQGKAILNGANIMYELVVVFCEMWRENWRKQEYNMSGRREYMATAVVWNQRWIHFVFLLHGATCNRVEFLHACGNNVSFQSGTVGIRIHYVRKKFCITQGWYFLLCMVKVHSSSQKRKNILSLLVPTVYYTHTHTHTHTRAHTHTEFILTPVKYVMHLEIIPCVRVSYN